MANPEHVARLKEGVEAWNRWRRSQHVKPDLSGIRLDDISLDYYELSEADLSNSRLRNFTFHRGVCRVVSFEHALIFNGIFFETPLTQTNFREAAIRFTTFDGCHLEESDFTSSSFGGNILAHAFLRDARGLATIEHLSPSSIGIDTFFESGGLPDSFLRGAGIPQEFIQYAASLARIIHENHENEIAGPSPSR